VLAPPVPTPRPWTPKPDPHRPSHALSSAVFGAALLAAAVVVGVDLVLGGNHAVVAVAAGVALAVLGLGIVAAGLSGRRAGGLAPLGVLLAVVTLVASSVGAGSWAGQQTWSPTGTNAYQLGVGTGRLELTSLNVGAATAAAPAEVDARVGLGTLQVVVPDGLAVRVVGSVGVGNARNPAGLGATTSGSDADVTRAGPHTEIDVQSSAAPVLVVHADVGVGTLVIDRPNGQEQ
jgi:hypothetical protein